MKILELFAGTRYKYKSTEADDYRGLYKWLKKKKKYIRRL